VRHWLVILALLATCTVQAKEKPKPLFIESANQTLAAPPADQAQIVFVEPINKIQGLFSNGIFELTGEQRTLLAVTAWKSRTAILIPPGKHTFYASQGGVGHIMEGNVEAGKRYYVLLRFIYANGFQLRPLRAAGTSEYRVTSNDFPKWMKETHWIEKTPEADVYFGQTIKEALDKVQLTAISNWQAKTAAEAAELTLNPEDAVAP